MDAIKLIFPSKEYKDQLIQFKKILLKSHNPFHGTGQMADYPIDKWIDRVADHRKGLSLDGGLVPATLFMAIRESDNQVIGLIQIRHMLNEKLLRAGGNIGYSLVSDERIGNYSTEMFRLCLQECKKLGLKRVLATCNKWNVGSARTIMANGGRLENEIMHNGELIQRYWINIA